MINQLTEEYDKYLQDLIRHGGSFDYNVLNWPGRTLANELVNSCLEILNEKKGTQITTEYVGSWIDIESLGIKVAVRIVEPKIEVKRRERNQVYETAPVLIMLPRFSSSFNREPQEWYKEAMKKIWEGYKKYKEESLC